MTANTWPIAIKFSIAGPEDCERASAVEIATPEISCGDVPVDRGPNDLRMGTTSHFYVCNTCGRQYRDCPGHPGLVRVKIPVQVPIAIAQTRQWLRAVCHGCGELVIRNTPEESAKALLRFAPAARLKEASSVDVAKVSACPRCGTRRGKVVKSLDDYFSFMVQSFAEGAGAEELRLLPTWEIEKIFGKVSAQSVRAVGVPPESHPSRFVTRIVPVIPITARPPIRRFDRGTSNDFKTNVLQYIVRRKDDPIPPEGGDVRPALNLSQLVYDMVKGGSRTQESRTGRRTTNVTGGVEGPPKAIEAGWPRKSGLFRGYMLGKQVVYIGRSVISGNSQLAIDEVAVSVAVARTLSVVEIVRPANRDWLTSLVLNGRDRYPGAARVVKARSGREYTVDSDSMNLILEAGDTVLRDAVDGDIALFNREPALEASAYGAHFLRVIRDDDPKRARNTFRINVIVCPLYNADFDGDAMNLIVPRSAAARTEAMVLSSVSERVISVKDGAPAIYQAQDSIVGVFGLTRDGVVIDRHHAMRLMARAAGEPATFAPLSSGREVVSAFLSQTPVNWRGRPHWYDAAFAAYVPYRDSETRVVVRHGRLVSGVLDTAADARGGIVHLVAREFGSQRALKVAYGIQQMALEFNQNRGFTVAFGDFASFGCNARGITRAISRILEDSNIVTRRLFRRELVPPIGMTTRGFYEQTQRGVLRTPDDVLRFIMRGIRYDSNGLLKMVMTGSKGKLNNLFHILAFVGQVELNAARIANIFAFARASPYFPRFDTDPAANGFVANSYIGGLRGYEVFFSAMNGRFDLINKALSTAATGYQMRKAINALQGIVLDCRRYCSKGGNIVSLLYGDDGFDVRRVERVVMRTVPLSDADLEAAFRLDVRASGLAGSPAEIRAAQDFFDDEFGTTVRDRNALRAAVLAVDAQSVNRPCLGGGVVHVDAPVDVGRVVENVLAAEGSPAAQSAVGLVAMREDVIAFCEKIPYFYTNSFRERRSTVHAGGHHIADHFRTAAAVFAIQVRTELCGRVLMTLDPDRLEYVFDTIRGTFKASLCQYGTAAGILAAQAVNEPLTQYMLDSHHRSVTGGTEKTGITRPSEIFGAKHVDKEARPVMFVRVRGKDERSRARVQAIANGIELLTVKQFLNRVDYLLEPLPFGTDAGIESMYPRTAGDVVWIRRYLRNRPGILVPGDLTNWCLRGEVSRSALILKGVDLELIAEGIRMQFPESFVVHTAEAAEEIVIRVYFGAGAFRRGGDPRSRFHAVATAVVDAPVRGVAGVTSVQVDTVSQVVVGADGSLDHDKDVFAVRTVGTNLADVLAHPDVDGRRTLSSSIHDTLRVLGVGAARAAIVREIREVLGAKAPSYRHLAIHADEMTRTGVVTSLEAGGLRHRDRTDVLLRASSHGPVQVLESAAHWGVTAPIESFAARLCCGLIPKLGTGAVELAVDADMVHKSIETVNSVLDRLGVVGE